MRNDHVSYHKVSPMDYNQLTKIMISAFNEDTFVHTGKMVDEPPTLGTCRYLRKPPVKGHC